MALKNKKPHRKVELLSGKQETKLLDPGICTLKFSPCFNVQCF